MAKRSSSKPRTSAPNRANQPASPTFEVIDISELTPDPNNARLHNPRNIGVIGDLLQDVGPWRSIGVDENNMVLMGNGVVEAAQERGFRKVLVVESDGETLVAVRRRGLSDEKKTAAAIGDNRSSELSEWDKDRLAALSLAAGNILAPFWNASELMKILPRSVAAGLTDPNAEVEPTTETSVSLGEVYRLGRHRLMCGDATNPNAVNLMMGGDVADGMWTDPPYGVSYVGRTPSELTIQNDDEPGLAALLTDTFAVANSILRTGAPVYVCHPTGRNAIVFAQAFVSTGWLLHQGLVWVKNALVMGHSDYHLKHEGIIYGWKTGRAHPWISDRTKVSTIEVDRPQVSAEHPTMKPVELVIQTLGNNFAAEGDDGVIYEPFCGSGTTMIACEQLGLSCRAMELSPVYVQSIITRWETFTGQRAEKV